MKCSIHRYVTVVFDEMKVRENLSAELVGFFHLGNIH